MLVCHTKTLGYTSKQTHKNPETRRKCDVNISKNKYAINKHNRVNSIIRQMLSLTKFLFPQTDRQTDR